VRKTEEDPGIEYVPLDHDATTVEAFTSFGARAPQCIEIAQWLDEALDTYIKATTLATASSAWRSQDARKTAMTAGVRAFEHLKHGDYKEAKKEASVAAALEAQFGRMLLWQGFDDALLFAILMEREDRDA
jgi:hypothetical protein